MIVASTENGSKYNLMSHLASISLALSLLGYPIIGASVIYFDLPNRWMTIPFRAIVVLLSLIVMLGYWGKMRLNDPLLQRLGIRYAQFWMCFWIFWGLYLTRIAIDTVFSDKEMRLAPWEFFAYAVGMCLIPAICLGVREVAVIRNYSLYLIIVLGVIGLGLTLSVYTITNETVNLDYLNETRVQIDTVNPITIARASVTIIILSLWQILSLGRGLHLKIRLPLVLVIMLGIFGLIAGASRGPTLSLVIVLPFIFYAAGVRGKWIQLIVAGCLFSVITTSYSNQLDLDNLFFTSRVGSGTFEDDSRQKLLADGIDVVINNPIFGGGVDALEFYPHNLILESFMIFGILSGLCFLFIQFYPLLSSFKLVMAGHPHCWIWFLLVQHSVNALFSGSLDSSSDLWVMMVVCMGELGRVTLNSDNKYAINSQKTYPAVLGNR